MIQRLKTIVLFPFRLLYATTVAPFVVTYQYTKLITQRPRAYVVRFLANRYAALVALEHKIERNKVKTAILAVTLVLAASGIHETYFVEKWHSMYSGLEPYSPQDVLRNSPDKSSPVFLIRDIRYPLTSAYIRLLGVCYRSSICNYCRPLR